MLSLSFFKLTMKLINNKFDEMDFEGKPLFLLVRISFFLTREERVDMIFNNKSLPVLFESSLFDHFSCDLR